MCTNPGCGATLNMRDLAIHENELCEYRKLKCHSCGEMTKTLADMEKRMETNQTNVEKNMETKFTNLEKNIATKLGNLEEKITKNNTATVETRLANVEVKMAQMKTDMNAKFETANNEVKRLKTALVEAFDQMKDVLAKMEDKREENARKVRNARSSERENIIVVGDAWNDSVEMFNWRERTWSPLQSMPKKRRGATSFVYNNQVVIAGGYCFASDHFDDMIKMNVDPHPDLSTHWSECPVKLPTKMEWHSSVLYKDKLMVTGGRDGNATSDKIHEVQVVPPNSVLDLIKNARTKTASLYGDI